MRYFLFLVLVLASKAEAKDYKFVKKIMNSDLQNELLAAGITVDSIGCEDNRCIAYNASADPSAVIAAYVYVDPDIKRRNNRAAAVALVKKLRAATATQADKDDLLGRLAFILLSE